MDRVHLEFIGNASRYIHTHCAYAIAFIVYSIQAFSSHVIKFRITKENEKEEDTINGRNKTFKFFSFNKSLCEKISVMLHISEFRVQKYADKGGFPLSLKFFIVYALVFDRL